MALFLASLPNERALAALATVFEKPHEIWHPADRDEMRGLARIFGRAIFLMSCAVVLLLMGACAGVDSSSSRQETISAAEACPGCRLSLDLVATLFPHPSEADFLMNTRIGRNSKGLFYVAPLVTESRMAVFSPSGTLVSTLGKKGAGPGEFDHIDNFYISRTDSLFVIDSTGRISVYDPEGVYARSFLTIGFPRNFAELGSGELLVNLWTFDGSGVGPLWAIDRTGKEDVQFRVAEDPHAGWVRQIDVGPNGDIWSVSRDYGIELFDSMGIARDAWRGQFGDLVRGRWMRPSKYAAHVTDIAIPGPDRMWILLARRDTTWRPAEMKPSAQPIMLSPREAVDQMDYYLDVVQPQDRRLIARESLGERFVGGFVNDTLIYTVDDDSIHDLVLRVWRVGLVQP